MTDHRAGFNGARVLVLEDEFLIAITVEDALRDRGATVVGPLHDVPSALAAADDGAPLAGAILDVHLGRGATSAEVARRLVAAGVPVVLYSGNAAEADRWIGLPALTRVDKALPARAAVEALLAATARGRE